MISRLRILDWPLLVVVMLLLLIGIAVIYTVTFPTVQFAIARAQIIYALIGLLVFVILTYLDYRSWRGLSFLIYLGGIALLIGVIFIGSKQFGAARWIDFGFFQLQPSEIFKLCLIFVLARLLASWSENMTVTRLLTFLAVAAVPIMLVFRQPDLGTAGVLSAITAGMLIAARLPLKRWLLIIALGLIVVPIGYSQLRDYQRARIKTFLTPSHDDAGQGYNVRQATIAIGSGGIFGQGLGRGSQSQLNFLPVAHTDFIFAGLAEATGLMGGSIVIILYFILISRCLRLAEVAKDEFGMFLAVGITMMFASQIVVNIGMNVGLLPVTGIPLPFISSGGTSLIVSFATLGILESIALRHKKIVF